MAKKATKLKKEAVQWSLASVVPAVVFCLTLINQGGYYEGAIVFAGLIMSAFLFAKGINIRFSFKNLMLFVFSVWYFFCSVKNGFVTEYAARGMLPFVLLIFSVYASNCIGKKEQIIDCILKFSAILAAFAIIQCIVLTATKGYFIRLLFPFNYSNASGIYFAVCFFLCIERNDRLLKKVSLVFIVSMLLTLSVGAIALSFVLICIKLIQKKKIKEFFIAVIAVIIAAFLLKNRIIQSGGTFLERLLQMHDGFLCMMKNPAFGIGAGAWETLKQSFQTGFYSANTIHSSFVQVGVNSGFLGLLLFVITVAAFLKDADKKYFPLCLMIIIHSLVDFSLSFSALGFFVILLANPETEQKYSENKLLKYITASLLMCVFITSAFGLYSVKSFNINTQNPNIFVRHSTQVAKSYAAYMNTQNKGVPKDMFILSNKPYELVLNEALSFENKDDYLIGILEKQPYNVKLMRFIEENFKAETVQKAKAERQKAVDSLSPIGEILYNLKGENQ
ncbi:MAG: O-antigen ligase family protein [Clostridia bacterium]|nr:O-antigen ligase family protein [Clostridia bacterium]